MKSVSAVYPLYYKKIINFKRWHWESPCYSFTLISGLNILGLLFYQVTLPQGNEKILIVRNSASIPHCHKQKFGQNQNEIIGDDLLINYDGSASEKIIEDFKTRLKLKNDG
jgi:hypothetical protein